MLDTGLEVTEGTTGEGNNFSGWSGSFTVDSAIIGCLPKSENNCDLPARMGGSAGSCAAGYVGSCAFTCNGVTGMWSETSNTCTLPATITTFEVCDASNTSCGPSITVPINTPLVINWDTDPNSAICVRQSGPGDFTTGNANNGSDTITANSVSGVADVYTLQCTNGGAPTSDTQSITVNTTFVNPILTVRKDGIGSPVSTVKIGDEVTVGWDSNNTDETVCSLTGGGLNIPNLPPGGNSEEGETGLVTIQGRTTFTIRCGALIGTKTVEVVPQGWES
jgi:hypothetical protein